MGNLILKIHHNDNVLVALQDLPAGSTLSFEGQEYTLPEPIPAKHKFFMQDMKAGERIIMYGVTVGINSQ